MAQRSTPLVGPVSWPVGGCISAAISGPISYPVSGAFSGASSWPDECIISLPVGESISDPVMSQMIDFASR